MLQLNIHIVPLRVFLQIQSFIMSLPDLSVDCIVYEYLKKNYKDVAKVFKKHVAGKPDSSELPPLQEIIQSYNHNQIESQKPSSPSDNGLLNINQVKSKKKKSENVKPKESK